MDILPYCERLLALAERDPRRVVPRAQAVLRQLAPSDPQLPWAHYTLGQALLAWERIDDARPHLQLAQAAFESAGLHPMALGCRYALLYADLLQRPQAEISDAFATLANTCIQADLPQLAIEARLGQARLLNVLGRPRVAEEILDQLVPLIGAEPSSQLARMLRFQGIAANLRGDYARALERLDQAERCCKALKLRAELGRCWLDQAWVALRQEQLNQALQGFRRADQRFAVLDLPLSLAFCAKNMGLAFIMQGAYDQALRTTLAALAHFTTIGRVSDIGACQLHLGNIYLHTGHWQAALACYGRAETIYTTLGLDGYRLVAQRNSAMVYRAQGRLSEAQTLLASAEAQAQASGLQAEVAEIWSIQAALLADRGQEAEALERYQQAHDLFTHIQNEPAAAECRLEQGWLALRQGLPDEAERAFDSAGFLLTEHPHHRWRLAYGLARCAELRGAIPEALAQYRTASATVAGLRGRLASEQLSSSLYAQAARLHTDALRLSSTHGAVDMLLEICEQQRSLALLRLLSEPIRLPSADQSELEAIQRRISRQIAGGQRLNKAEIAALDETLAEYGDALVRARHSQLARPTIHDISLEAPFNLAQLRKQLMAVYGSEWTMVSYTIHDNHLLIISITPHTLEVERTPYDLMLQRLIDRASQASYRLYTYRDVPLLQGKSRQPWQGLESLAARLIPASVQRRLNPEHRLIVVPSGPLHGLPWSALRLGQRWLVALTMVQVVPSLAIWQVLDRRPQPHHKTALLIGCSSFGGRAPDLPAVPEELATVARRWPATSHIWRDSAVTRAALRRATANDELMQYGLIHIATHARLLPSHGLAAHIKLWDGDMLLPEIADLSLDGALVTLSACDGAAGEALPGEEVLSLSRAFLAAGARGVLASLWPVADDTLIQLMDAFYYQFQRHGDAVRALNYVQRTLIDEPAGENQPGDVLSWGSFVLVGAGRVFG